MDNILLLQFSSMLITALLVMMLTVGRAHLNNPESHYETSRWLLVMALVVLSVHYLLQMLFGFRAKGDDVGAVVNILFYAPSSYLMSYSIINLASGKKYKRRYLITSISFYTAILASFIAGLKIYGTLHMRVPMYIMGLLFFVSQVIAIMDPLKETRRIRGTLESDTSGDLSNYNRFMRTGNTLLFLFGIMVPVIIFSRKLLFVIGPLFLLSLVVHAIGFLCLGFNMNQVTDVLTANEDASAPYSDGPEVDDLHDVVVIPQEQKDRIARVLDAWVDKGGFTVADVSLDKLARKIDEPSRVLSQFIQNEYGMTFRIWLSKIRIDEAKRRLVDSPDSKIESIAEDCGFTSRSYFQNLFKAETGLTPREWRSKMCGL